MGLGIWHADAVVAAAVAAVVVVVVDAAFVVAGDADNLGTMRQHCGHLMQGNSRNFWLKSHID